VDYDYSKLNGRIVERYKTQIEFAKAVELSERSLSLKLNNLVGWKQREIARAARLLGLTSDEIGTYFFTLNDQSA